MEIPPNGGLDYFASTTGASGAFLPTEAMPFSIDDVVLYISLFPIGSPFAAFRTKNAEPSFAGFALEAFIVVGVFLDRRYAAFGGLSALIGFARQNYLAVPGL